MGKIALIGALAPLVLLAQSARADFRAPIAGAEPAVAAQFVITVRPHAARLHPAPLPGSTPILPTRFVPAGGAVAALPADAAPLAHVPVARIPVPRIPGMDFVASDAVVSLPLVDRHLSPAEREADLGGDLQNAILRIEPVYDPTRLDGPDAELLMTITSGTAAMDNVFADHWRRATPDPNVGTRVAYIAMAWQRPQALPCTAFEKARSHDVGGAELTALSAADCRRLLVYERLRYDAAPPDPIAVGAVSLPVFAAPMPGARLSSAGFWAARRAQIDAIQARLHDQWQSRRERVSDIRPRP